MWRAHDRLRQTTRTAWERSRNIIRKQRVRDQCADFCAINLQRLGFTGMHDPVATIVFGQPVNVDYTVVAGKFIVKEGHLVTLDTRQLAEKHTQAAKRLWQAS